MFINEFISINIISYGFFLIVYWYASLQQLKPELLTKLNLIKVIDDLSVFVHIPTPILCIPL